MKSGHFDGDYEIEIILRIRFVLMELLLREEEPEVGAGDVVLLAGGQATSLDVIGARATLLTKAR